MLVQIHMETNDQTRKGRVIIEGNHATIIFERVMRHAPELVWQAITNPEDLKKWLMCSSAKIEGQVGGSVEMFAGPAQFHVTGKVLAWDPPRMYAHEWKVAPSALMPQGEDAICRYELIPQGSHTLLKITYERLTQQTSRGFAPGTHVLLDRMEAQLDKTPLPDWMKRFGELQSIYPAWSN
jgi:uncharacterized protein YndB with AHSA1/START domain